MERVDVPAIAAWLVVLILVSPSVITNLFESSTTIHHSNIRLILWICYAILWFIFAAYLFAPNRIWDHLRHRKKDYVVLIVTVLVLLIIIEFGWQFSNQVDIGSQKANITDYEYSHSVQLNEYGFRDQQFSKGKSLTTKRILIYGDEIVFGEGVDTDQKIDVLTEQKLNKRNDGSVYQVYAIGHPGDNPTDYPKYIEQMPKISGDIVIFVFNVDNDVVSGVESLDNTKEDMGALLDMLHVPKLITRDITGTLCSTVKTDRYQLDSEYEELICNGLVDRTLVLDSSFQDVQERYDAELSLFNKAKATKEAILTIRDEGQGGEFLLVISPSKYQLGEEHFATMREVGLIRQNGSVSRDIQDSLIAWAEEEDIAYLDLLPVLEQSSTRPFYEISTNYNSEGNALIAESLIPLVFS